MLVWRSLANESKLSPNSDTSEHYVLIVNLIGDHAIKRFINDAYFSNYWAHKKAREGGATGKDWGIYYYRYLI